MDAGFYRGTSADQDNRFGDKEKKLLKQMKFEAALDQKVDMSKVNLEVVKPWITGKLNEILGVEDDVVIEYVFTLLEDQKDLNPKVMQINLTGFLNARRAREFVGELWAMLVEAQSSPDGIPSTILEKKMQELKASGSGKFAEPPLAKVISNDWKHRYQSLTGGRYGKAEPNYESQPMAFDPTDKSERIPSPRGRRHDDRDRRGDRWDRDRDRSDRDRHRDRDRSRERGDHQSRRRSPSPPVRKPREEERKISKRHHSSDEASDAGSDREVKKKKKAHRHSDESDSERQRRKAKKHKKEKKEKKEKKKKREKEDSD